MLRATLIASGLVAAAVLTLPSAAATHVPVCWWANDRLDSVREAAEDSVDQSYYDIKPARSQLFCLFDCIVHPWVWWHNLFALFPCAWDT